MKLDKKTLKQYRALQREIKALDKKLDNLYDRDEKVPIVAGKVTGSSSSFPYTEVRTTVQMYDPEKQDNIDRLIAINQERRDEAEKLLLEIEEYIASMPDSVTRQIFELTYLKGRRQREIADDLFMTQGRVSQLIRDTLKD